MFANDSAIRTLVCADATATERDKANVLRALEGEGGEVSDGLCGWRDRGVVSFREAAAILGYTSPRTVHAAVRNGILEGYYGGKSKERASGVLTSSIVRALR